MLLTKLFDKKILIHIPDLNIAKKEMFKDYDRYKKLHKKLNDCYSKVYHEFSPIDLDPIKKK